MIKNYLTVAIRNLMRHKLYTSINVLGLAIGLACGILILLYIQQEFAVNRSHTLSDRIYKVIREERSSTQTTYSSGTSGALGPVLKETFPEVETTVRIWRFGGWGVSAQYGERTGQYTFALVDDNFLDIFDFPLIKGDPETAFRTPYSVVITDDMAQHLFGDLDPMGKTFSIDNVNSASALRYRVIGYSGRLRLAWPNGDRTKEIGMRKVLGASTPHLVMLLSREFMLLILLANLIAWPIAYYLMRDWLSGFAYQTDLTVLPFVASAIIALIIAFGTVSMQAIRAARSNPIDALRYE